MWRRIPKRDLCNLAKLIPSNMAECACAEKSCLINGREAAFSLRDDYGPAYLDKKHEDIDDVSSNPMVFSCRYLLGSDSLCDEKIIKNPINSNLKEPECESSNLFLAKQGSTDVLGISIRSIILHPEILHFLSLGSLSCLENAKIWMKVHFLMHKLKNNELASNFINDMDEIDNDFANLKLRKYPKRMLCNDCTGGQFGYLKNVSIAHLKKYIFLMSHSEFSEFISDTLKCSEIQEFAWLHSAVLEKLAFLDDKGIMIKYFIKVLRESGQQGISHVAQDMVEEAHSMVFKNSKHENKIAFYHEMLDCLKEDDAIRSLFGLMQRNKEATDNDIINYAGDLVERIIRSEKDIACEMDTNRRKDVLAEIKKLDRAISIFFQNSSAFTPRAMESFHHRACSIKREMRFKRILQRK
ncbi:hypothetical protein ENBRE01_2791 [Enteropsectra breve]|nr:hypothetical protein ENBRE01_2791 [Enteropsectra breve]